MCHPFTSQGGRVTLVIGGHASHLITKVTHASYLFVGDGHDMHMTPGINLLIPTNQFWMRKSEMKKV